MPGTQDYSILEGEGLLNGYHFSRDTCEETCWSASNAEGHDESPFQALAMGPGDGQQLTHSS